MSGLAGAEANQGLPGSLNWSIGTESRHRTHCEGQVLLLSKEVKETSMLATVHCCSCSLLLLGSLGSDHNL